MKHAPVIAFLLFCTAVNLTAQEKVDLQVMQKIKDEEKNNSQVAMIAHNLTDVCGPRLTNSPGYNRALEWVTQTFNQWGLVNAGREPWGEFGKGWSTEGFSLAMTRPYFAPVIGHPVAWTSGTNGTIEAPVVLLEEIDSAAIDRLGDIRGKVILQKSNTLKLRSAFEPYATRYADTSLANMHDTYMFTREELEGFLPFLVKEYRGLLYLKARGAAAFLSSRASGRDGTIIVQGSPGYAKGYDPVLPDISISREDCLKMQRLLEDKKPVTVQVHADNKFYENDLTGYNVVGEIAGTDPKLKSEVVMLGAHLDSWHSGTGATDNAAGCVVMMEVMRILKALNIQPKRTIRIALWGGEEQGLYGSFGYVKKHFGDPRAMVLKDEQKRISAYYNLDNGSGKVRGIYLQNNENVKGLFQSWLAPFEDMGATTVTMANTGSTDHISFDAVGIPAFEFIQDPLEYSTRTHHTNMDTYEHLSIEDLQQAAVVIAGFVYNTAMRPEMIPRKTLPPATRFLFDADIPL